MKVCAVVPVYRHVATVGRALDALAAADLFCIVVDDGNDDGDARRLREIVAGRGEVVRLPGNQGKGAAIQAGLRAAGEHGFTHALQIDADGQHDTGDIPKFLEMARQHPEDMVYGVPSYDDSVPRARLYGRYATHVWVWINTWSLEIRDSMCGFRVYPLAAVLAVLERGPLPARMGFDIEVLVRLQWRGVRFRAIPTRIVYPVGGISHFRMWQDNLAISWMHTRLFFGMLVRMPLLAWRKLGFGRREPAPVQHWASIGENTWVGGIAFLLFVHRIFGRWPFRVAVFPVVYMNWLLRPSVRRASRDYLRRVAMLQPDWPRSGRSSLHHVMRFADTLLDKLLAVGGRYPRERVRVEGRAALRTQLATGRGAVIVTAHMGCLELCQNLVDTSEGVVRLTILMHTRHAAKFNRVLGRINPVTTVKIMEVTEITPVVAMRLAELVGAGELVAIAGDRVPVAGAAMVNVPLLGTPANFPVGPYILAALLDCPLYFLCCAHEGDGYLVNYELLAGKVSLPRGQRQARLADYASLYVRALEARLRAAPLDWFNFFDFWKQGNGQVPRA